MRIAEVRTHVLEARLSQPFSWSFNRTDLRSTCLVEIICEDGTSGWGECFGPARLNAAIIAAYRPILVGEDALATERHWQTLYNQFRDQGQKGLAITALSGVDIALWDLKGKHFDAPVHVLMGGPLRREVAAYATGTYRTDTGDPMQYILDEVRGYVAEGFGAVKLKIGFGVVEDVALIRAVREAIGPRVGLMLDANHGYDTIEAIAVGRAVEACDIGWFEEPVVPDDLDSYVEVRRGQPIPVAGGECEFTRWGFREILTRRAIDILQPDTCAAGGLSECKKIADMATAFGVRYVPHVWGTGVGLAAALQLLAVLPHAPPRHTPREPLLEFDRSEHPFRQAILRSKGIVRIPDGPGLGIEIDREALEKFKAADA
jgi:D-galactarolactone cycloisomerase